MVEDDVILIQSDRGARARSHTHGVLGVDVLVVGVAVGLQAKRDAMCLHVCTLYVRILVYYQFFLCLTLKNEPPPLNSVFVKTRSGNTELIESVTITMCSEINFDQKISTMQRC